MPAMNEYILLMHADAEDRAADWEPYLNELGRRGVLRGGSAIGEGTCHRRSGTPAAPASITGFVRIEVASLAEAEACLSGNPVYEAGGTVELRHLPRD
jgi:hypothetical protein